MSTQSPDPLSPVATVYDAMGERPKASAQPVDVMAVKGQGFDSRTGGFAEIIIGGETFDAQEIARMVRSRAAVAELVEAADLIERSAYTVSTEIDPRGYRWSEAYLDQALPRLRAALARVQGGAA